MPGRKGVSVLMRWWHRVLPDSWRQRPQWVGRARADQDAWCLPRQPGRTVTRQMGRLSRPAEASGDPGEAGSAGQRRNVPAGAIRD
jgi:hypothetical protein